MIQAMPPMYESTKGLTTIALLPMPISKHEEMLIQCEAADALSFDLGCSLGCCRKRSKCHLDHPKTATAQSLGSCQKAQALISDLTFILEVYFSLNLNL